MPKQLRRFLGVDPGHQAAQAAADLFDLQIAVAAAGGFEGWRAGAVFQNPLAGELAGLDFRSGCVFISARVSSVTIRGPRV